MTAPERIWIDANGGNWSPRAGGTQGVEFVRADLVAAQIAAAVQAEREACAAWCEANTMDVANGVTDRKYAGMYTNGENTGGTHAGMGYAAAIRARGGEA